MHKVAMNGDGTRFLDRDGYDRFRVEHAGGVDYFDSRESLARWLAHTDPELDVRIETAPMYERRRIAWEKAQMDNDAMHNALFEVQRLEEKVKELSPPARWRVIYRDDDEAYVMATSRVFSDYREALCYAGTVADSREALVVKEEI